MRLSQALFLVVLLTVSAISQASLADKVFIGLRRDRMIVIFRDGSNALTAGLDGESRFVWEGHMSSVTITSGKDGCCEVRWKWDVLGPPWAYLTLRQESDRLIVCLDWQATSDAPIVLIGQRAFAGLNEALADREVGQALQVCLRRIGQRPVDVDTAIGVCRGGKHVERLDAQVNQLLGDLQNKDWKSRRRAAIMLTADPALLLDAVFTANGRELSVAQRVALGAMTRPYRDVPDWMLCDQ